MKKNYQLNYSENRVAKDKLYRQAERARKADMMFAVLSDYFPSTDGLKVLDLTRILAGPTCTQLLGDLGADVIKIERPGAGDDTRKWGPPYLKDRDGEDRAESAYYLSCNRNKRSVALDISRPGGSALVRRLLAHCGVLIENFKVGGLKKYGLDHGSLRGGFPRLVYCSITGFGQTGPYAHLSRL